MVTYALLVSPRAKGAYYGSYLDVSKVELAGVAGVSLAGVLTNGDMDFLQVEAPEKALTGLAALSFVHGIFGVDGDALRPLDVTPDFRLHEDFVFGSKYRGKTNETLTQLLINLGLQQLGKPNGAGVKLLDPMCGRGTSLIWALRYGMHAVGIDHDKDALPDMRRHLKKWTKLHRVKHSLTEEKQKASRRRHEPVGLRFETGEVSLRFLLGETSDTQRLVKDRRFDLITTDIPYGVQHSGREGTRNPLETVAAAAEAWTACLRSGGVMVVSFNRNLPKRAKLEAVFSAQGLTIAEIPLAHRMSESIVRDVLVLRKTA